MTLRDFMDEVRACLRGADSVVRVFVRMSPTPHIEVEFSDPAARRSIENRLPAKREYPVQLVQAAERRAQVD